MSHAAAGEPAATAGPQGDGAGQPTGDQVVDPAAQAEGDTPEGQGDEPETDWQAEAEKWKSLARKHERTAGQNADAAKRLKTIEDQNKTDLQRAQEAQQEAERQRDEALETHARIMAAATHDVPVDLIDLLGTGTAEEIDERAQLVSGVIQAEATRLANQMFQAAGIDPASLANGGANGSPTASGAAARAGHRPVESMGGGTQPARGTQPMTSDDWLREQFASSR
jgi:hypothetical protein